MKHAIARFALIAFLTIGFVPLFSPGATAQNYLQVDQGITLQSGGRLVAGHRDVLVEAHDVCRWLDNASPDSAFFVPLRSAFEWTSFVNNAPAAIVRDECCPAGTATLQSSDSQVFSVALPVGRDGAAAPLGQTSRSHTFTIVRAIDGATWPETVTEAFHCTGGAWVGQGAVIASNPPPLGCSGHPDGSTWFEITSQGSRAANISECPDGPGDRHATWDIESEYRCVAGTPTLTGGSRAGPLVWTGTCSPPPATAATDVVALPANKCPSGSWGCQWGGDRTTRIDQFNWSNAAYMCAYNGYKYLVAAEGENGRGDCSSCQWGMWTHPSVGGDLAQLSSLPLPAANTWNGRGAGSWSSASSMYRVWCSNTPNQRVPATCRGGPTDVPVSVVTGQTCRPVRGGTMSCTDVLTSATLRTTLPDGYHAYMSPWRPVAIKHPDDTRPVYAGNDAKFARPERSVGSRDALYQTSGTVELNGQSLNASGWSECQANGQWRHYRGGCRAGGSGVRGVSFGCYD